MELIIIHTDLYSQDKIKAQTNKSFNPSSELTKIFIKKLSYL